MENMSRKKIETEVYRDLYLRSGNRCAFKNCRHELVDKNGIFCGEIAHICAANPRGARYDANMTDDERASYDNLILLCPTHHTKIDKKKGEAIYTVEVLKKMKADHEKKFSGIIDAMIEKFPLRSSSDNESQCVNCKRITAVLNWGLNEEELVYTVQQFNKLFSWFKEKELNFEPAYLFTKILKFSKKPKIACTSRTLNETEFKTRLEPKSLSNYEPMLGILIDKGLVSRLPED